MPLTRPSSPGRARRGLTLVELLVTLTMLVVVGATLGTLLVSQTRLFLRNTSATQVQRDLRTGLGLLPMDLRGVAREARTTLGAGSSDLVALQDSAIQLRATIGGSIVCERGGTGTNWLVIPPRLGVRSGLTTWYAQPQPGDSVLLYNGGPNPGPNDDAWFLARITHFETSTACAGEPFTDPRPSPAGDGGKTRWRVTLDRNLPDSVWAGAPIRFLRSVRYSLYRPGADPTRWYLGYREYSAGAWTTIEPIAGPFDTYNATRGGIRFAYFDTLGQALGANPAADAVGRIDLTFRARQAVRGQGTRDSVVVRDSVAVRVALRNRL